MQYFEIEEEYITLVKFLKINDIISSGGEAKFFIEENDIFLNDQRVVEKRKKIYVNDILNINGSLIKVEIANKNN